MLRVGLAIAVLAAPSVAQTIFVNAAAAGAGDGKTWADAFTNLQPALQSASPGQAIWVAAGTYHPAHPGGSRAQTFQLPSGVEVYGGFAGDELTLEERKDLFLSTFLSGDLNGDDAPGFAGVFLPPGLDPILAGLLVHHAGAVLGPSTYLPELTSTAFPLQILP